MCDVMSRRGQLRLLQQMIFTAQMHLSERLRAGEEIPLVEEVLRVVQNDIASQCPKLFVSPREIEAFTLRRLLFEMPPYFRPLRDVFVRSQYLPRGCEEKEHQAFLKF